MENRRMFSVMLFVVLTYITNVGADQDTEYINIIYDDWSIVLKDYMSCKEVAKNSIKVHMVTTTNRQSSTVHKKCVKPSNGDIYELIPVYSDAVNLHFKNKFCSKFVETYKLYTDSRKIYDTLTYWSVVVELECFLRQLSLLSEMVPYNTFLSKYFGRNLECDINIYPPFQYDVLGTFDGSNCTQNLKPMCQAKGKVKSNYESSTGTSCSACSWVLQENVCLDPLYIESTQLQTYIKLLPPEDNSYIHQRCMDIGWMPDVTRRRCINPIQSVSGLLTYFWIKLIKVGADAEIEDKKISKALEKELEIGTSMMIRFVKQNKTADDEEDDTDTDDEEDDADADDEEDDTDTDYEEVVVMNKPLRCKRMRMAISVTQFMPLKDVNEFVSRMKTILQTSNVFDIDENVQLHISLHQPSCFVKQSSSGSQLSSKSSEGDSEHLDGFMKEMIALAIGFLVPVVVAVLGVGLFMVQHCSIQILHE